VAAALRKEPGIAGEVVDGNRGEFTVLLDGNVVAEKGESMPTVEDVVAAVKKANPAAAR
jgi:hypothetical protein